MTNITPEGTAALLLQWRGYKKLLTAGVATKYLEHHYFDHVIFICFINVYNVLKTKGKVEVAFNMKWRIIAIIYRIKSPSPFDRIYIKSCGNTVDWLKYSLYNYCFQKWRKELAKNREKLLGGGDKDKEKDKRAADKEKEKEVRYSTLSRVLKYFDFKIRNFSLWLWFVFFLEKEEREEEIQ